jgi:hypothetical protein
MTIVLFSLWDDVQVGDQLLWSVTAGVLLESVSRSSSFVTFPATAYAPPQVHSLGPRSDLDYELLNLKGIWELKTSVRNATRTTNLNVCHLCTMRFLHVQILAIVVLLTSF